MFPIYSQPTYVLNVDQKYSDYLEKLNHNGKIPCPLFELITPTKPAISMWYSFRKFQQFSLSTHIHSKQYHTQNTQKQYHTQNSIKHLRWSFFQNGQSKVQPILGGGDLVKSPINKNCLNCRASNDINMNCITFWT